MGRALTPTNGRSRGRRSKISTAATTALDIDRLHLEASLRLAAVGQRYTASRRALVEAVALAGRPVAIPEVLADAPGVPQSSAYRNLTVLCDAKVARRIAGSDDLGRFELSEDLSGRHHHHLVCSSCGTVRDIAAFPRLEQVLAEAARLAASETGYEVDDHRIDLAGRCPQCQ
ncbi:MAG TPA: transcriptional repressor [Acidimicrobiales bacterium]|nr:transcriptional repressor [Acidimicrobiales bacterium]